MTDLRLIDSPIGKVIPAADLADNIGYDRSSITKIIAANEEFFEGLKLYQSLSTGGGEQLSLCLNKTGIDRLLFLIRPHKNRKELCRRVEEFKLKAFGKMESAIAAPVSTNLHDEITRARMLATETGGDPREFMKIALDKCGAGDYAPALNSSSIVHGEPGQWFNPTQLAAMVGDVTLNAERVNHYLHNKGYQWKDGYTWRLTPEGMHHGEEFWYTSTSKHGEWRIRWRESILYASGLKKQISPDQLALPEKAGAS